MDANGMPGGLLPGMASGMLGQEMSLHHHQHQMVAFAPHDNDRHSQSQQSIKQQASPYTTKSKQQQPALSDEDEPGFTGDDAGDDGRKRMSPWQRMKWTDNMVRLLIMVVFYIGDDGGGLEGNDPSTAGKRKSGGLLQKKGKWKSVSKAMMEKGFYVSPQQCEDKFNDLNKRYKRVNDILGKGTACKVVENQSLLETMDQLSAKKKEEVRKLLNSKHLFFREMCAYHNSCGGGGGSAAGAHQSSEAALESSHRQQQRCLHSSERSAAVGGDSRSMGDTEGLKMERGGNREEEEDDYSSDDDDEDEDEDEEEREEEEMEDGGRGGRDHNEHGGEEEEKDNFDKLGLKKKQRRGMFCSSLSKLSPAMQQLSSELKGLLQDGTKSPWEQRHWMKSRAMQLEEQRVSFQCQEFELEKQRLKWVKFSWKKEREMERMRVENERMKLENERMILLLRQKELELLDIEPHHHQQQQQQQHSSNKRPSS